jgi:RNA polymerase sigma-70 factor, ECF subfamily
MAGSDQELTEKAKAGDKQAFTELYSKYSGRILAYLYRYVGNYETAEDLTVETFLNAYNRLSAYEERGMFSSWLFRIATNCAKMEARRRGGRGEVSLDAQPVGAPEGVTLGDIIADESNRPDYEARKKEFKEFVEKILSKLDKKYREAFLLCDVEGLGYEKTARILNSNTKTIGTRIRRARKMFYDILRKYGYSF